jgi:hypothetical protein
MTAIGWNLSGRLALVLALAMTGAMIHPAWAAPPLPTSVSNVAITAGSDSVAGGAVCRANDTGSVGVSALVSVTFDSNSNTPGTGTCRRVRCAGQSTGAGSCSERTDSLTTVTVTPSLVVTASDGTNNGPLAGTNPGTFTGSLTEGSEGKTTVTVTANASESVSTQTDTTLKHWGTIAVPNTDCSGSPLTTDATVPGTPVLSSRDGSANDSNSYLIDKIGPTATIFNNPPTISQTESEIVHIKISDGSAGMPWSVTVTATGPSANQITTSDSDTFGTSPDGIKKETNAGPITLPTACDTPIGDYTVAATVDTQDLCGNLYDTINLVGDPFAVTSGTILAAQTGVLSQLTSGEYGIDQCFVDSVKQAGKKVIVNNTPGSVHIDTLVTSAGTCAGLGTISGVTLTLQLPDLVPDGTGTAGFSYEVTGASPNAHIFVGDGSGGIDLHDGTPLTEVTDQVAQVRSGQTITIDLSGLDLGSGPGVIPASDTIFARAHARFNATTKNGQPLPDTAFKFSSSATADVGSAASDYYISGNPTQSMDNLTGALQGDGPKTCDADGLFITP